ncbi:MAG: retron St85 family RNA-directed DNA polymerase [Flavobacteriaceae bacterium]|nr:retron St85 family RNA-directed DNA polymerase [Flavobacteriaceae bacterium]
MTSKDNIRLSLLGLPIIQSIDDFSKITHISKYTIYQLSRHSEKYYLTYEILKKSGGKRKISQPSKKLKGLQSWILVNILNKLEVSNSSKGFEKGSSIADNAKPHVNSNCILNVDLRNFFDTITTRQVYNVFKTIGYNQLVSTILCNICTYKGSLPQGSPCSPRLSNLVAWKLDKRLQGYVGKRGITYTRYADDMTFSGLNPLNVVQSLPTIKKIVEEEGFELNSKKTRVSGASRSKIVTGLTISEGSYGIGKKKYKILRAKIQYLTRPSEQKNLKRLDNVSGWLSYLNSVDNKRYNKAMKYIEKLKKAYPDTIITKL